MRRCLVSLVLLTVTCSAALADMIIYGGALPYRHDRYYVGADKAFIGESYDWSGVGFSTAWGRFATLISPSYFLSANHSHPAVGENVRFNPGNVWGGEGTFTRVVESGVQIGFGDLWLGKLSSPVPSTTATYPIWVPSALTNVQPYQNKECLIYGSPSRVGKNVVTTVQVLSGQPHSNYVNFAYDMGVPDESYLQGGDSGGPSFRVVDGQLAIVGIHYGIMPQMSIDTFVPAYIDLLLSQMGGEYFHVGPANYWKGTTGSWATNSNWTCDSPVTQADAVIANGGTAQFSTGTLRLNSLSAGVGGVGYFQMSGGTMTITEDIAVGNFGGGDQGSLTLSGGTLTVPVMTMGVASGAGGTCTLGGSASLTTTALTVGDAGTGTFTQTAGTHGAGAVVLGKSMGGSGSYALSGGTLTLTTLTVGDAGTGTFTHSNVTVQPTAVTLGKSTSGVGTYTLGSGQLTLTTLTVGDAGRGTFTQNGGAVTASTLTVGKTSSAGNVYNLNSGTLGAGNLYVGDGGSGSFAQVGGTLTATTLALGNLAGSTGTYSLSGSGQFNGGSIIVGASGTGAFNQSGGAVSVGGDVVLGQQASGAGTYRISGGSLAAGNLTVGAAGGGTLAIDSAAASIALSGTLALGSSGNLTAVAGSAITLNGGNLANTATDSARFAGMNNLGLVLHSTAAQTLEVGGRNVGVSAGGFANNYKLASLQVGTAGAPASAKLMDATRNNPSQVGKDAMHVDHLSVAAGSTLDLNGLNLYYHTIDNQGTIALNGGHIFRDNLTTLRVWVEAEEAAIGEDFDVRIFAQILGGWSGEGISDIALSVYSPSSVGALTPKEVGTIKKSVQTVWAPDIAAAYSTIKAIPGDMDHDGDLDAVQMAIGDLSGFIPDLGLTPVLLATQTWTKLAEDPVGLAVSAVSTSRHYDLVLGKQSFGWQTGDFGRDGAVDGTDINAVYLNFGSSGAYDLTGDGTVNQADVDCLVRDVLGTGYGDANVDRRIDFVDFQAMLDHWQQGAGWAQADFNNDHFVDFEDFQVLLDNWNPTGFGASEVPEPATALLLCAGLALCSRRRRVTSAVSRIV